MKSYNLFVFTVFLVILIAIGLLAARKVKNENQYLLANRKTQLFALIATLVMTEFNTATLVAFSSAGYYARWWALSLPFIFLFGLLFYAAIVAKKWKLYNGISVANYFSQRYGRDIGILAAVILFLAMSGFSATYIKALTLIFNPLFPGINQWQCSGILLLIVLLMTWRGGLLAIIRTDIISFLVMLFFFPLLLFYTWHVPTSQFVHHLNLSQMQQALPLKFVVSLIFLTMFSYILAPWYGQKIISAASPSIATKAVAIAAIFIFIFYGLAITITSILATKGISLSQAEQALPYAIAYALPIGWQGIGYAVLFLTSATTLAGIWSAMITLLIGVYNPQANERKLFFSLILAVACALVTYLLANLFVDKIFNKMILANIPVVALSFALLAGFYWKKTTKLGVHLSIIVGLFWGIGCYLYFGEKNIFTWYWAVYGIPFIFLFGILGSLIENLFKSKILNDLENVN